MKSVLLLFLVLFTLFWKTLEAGYDYYSIHWVVDQGTCRNSYGEAYFCIHYSNCYPKGYFRNQGGQTRLCGFHYDKIIMCCIEDDDLSQDYGFLDYFFQKRKFPFSTTQRSKIIRNHYTWTSFSNGNLKDQYVSGQSTITPVKTSIEKNVQGPGTTERVYTSVGDTRLPEQSTNTKGIDIISNTEMKQDDLVNTTTESIHADAISILTTPTINKDQSTLLITTATDYQSSVSEEALTLTDSIQNSIVKTNDEENSMTASLDEEITIANSIDISVTSTTSIDSLISSIFKNDSDTFTDRPNLDQNQSDSAAVEEDDSETTEIIQEDTQDITEQQESKTATTNSDSLTTTPAIVIPLRSFNTNLDESIVGEGNQFGTRSLISQIERNDIQEDSSDQGLSQLEIDAGISIPKYAPALENSTSLRKCRDVYMDAKRDFAWRHRSSNKALLGYGEENDIEWLCGGSLISEIFVLTAARCQYNNTNPAKFIQLGSSETSNQLIKRGIQNFTITDFILHPLYGTTQNNHYDLALVKLNASAIFTDYVKPACLSTTPDLGTVPLWLPNDVPIHYVHISNEICRTIYNDTRNTISERLQICAVTDSFLKCQYDLGAPLVYVNSHYSFGYFPEIRGIASFGEPCVDKPAVCTKVLAYVSWIESVVWPEG